jgi:hypothetical protein
MNPPADIRWQQRLMNFERALRLLREAMAHGPEALNQLERKARFSALNTASSWPGKP